MKKILIAVIACVFVTVAGVTADNWPQFRGLNGGVAADDAALPESWSESENVVWKVDIAGRGWSSPVVWNDVIFVTSATNTKTPEPPLNPVDTYVSRSLGGPMTGADITRNSDEYRWTLYAFDFKTGAVRWERTIHTSVPPERHQKNSYASETPITDGERVYVYLGNAGLFAFDMGGQPVWSTPLPPRKMRLGWGPAASPALYRDRVIIVNDNEEGSFLAAFDTRTGRELWRTPREEASNWSTPFVWENSQRTEIITTGSKKVRSYDLDGKLLWEISGMSSIHVPTPFARDGLLYVSSGYVPDPLRPAYVVRPGASGDISLKEGETSNAHIVWSQPLVGSFHPSPLVYDGIYYTLLDRGFLTANDAKTGEAIYGRQRISAESSAFTASPFAYNGKIFALSEDGDTFVIQAGREFKLLGKNSLNEMTLATPAIVNGNLIIRTASRLYRIGRVRP